MDGINPERGQTPNISVLIDESNGKVIVGRRKDLVHIHLPNGSISGQHATLRPEGGSVWIEDRNSSNGTKVNGIKLAPLKAMKAESGARIEFGEVKLFLRKV